MSTHQYPERRYRSYFDPSFFVWAPHLMQTKIEVRLRCEYAQNIFAAMEFFVDHHSSAIRLLDRKYEHEENWAILS